MFRIILGRKFFGYFPEENSRLILEKLNRALTVFFFCKTQIFGQLDRKVDSNQLLPNNQGLIRRQ